MSDTNLLGAIPGKNGVNFAIYSKNAREVFLLLFDTPGGSPTDVISLKRRNGDVWHVFVRGIKAGQFYGYKIRGDYEPAKGLRFNENKLLIDPYAKALSGKFKNRDYLLFAYQVNSPDKDLTPDRRDSARVVPRCIVVDDKFDWKGDKRPAIPPEKLVIYEAHLKGFTAHRSSGVKSPGTYAGFIGKIPYLKELGVNAVELLPLHEFYQRDQLENNGLREYWGYNTVCFFAPESSYSSSKHPGSQVNEFKTLVRELHRAGIAVIMDVVFNHTAEGNEYGPTLSLKGIDNPTYYILEGAPGQPLRSYKDDASCGNTFNAENPCALRLITDSLRYWADTMHVDGFRFDLAAVLGRKNGVFSRKSPFFNAIRKDPVLSKVFLIAEPWDATTYQVSGFPKPWFEWNDKFRDAVRRFYKGEPGSAEDLSLRLTGSPDLYAENARPPFNSINFVTCHDGFTLNDLYSYDRKHNEANCENNRDGSDNNYSWNCGVEGETADMNIINLRKRMVKNALSCLFFSFGTPMLLGGDEFLRTQHGNNNAYCQDNEMSWFDWTMLERNRDIYEFCRKAVAFRKEHPVLNRKNFPVPGIKWFGEGLDEPAWDNPDLKLICCLLGEKNTPGLFYIFNADTNSRTVRLPRNKRSGWLRVADTSLPSGEDFLPPDKYTPVSPGESYKASPRSFVLLYEK